MRSVSSNMYSASLVQQQQDCPKRNLHFKNHISTTSGINSIIDDLCSPILPGLPDDVAKHCLALVPRANFPAMSRVSHKWRSLLRNKEFIMVRKLAGKLEEWLYVMIRSTDSGGSRWEVFDCYGTRHGVLPPMIGPVKAHFGVVTVNGKLLVMAGYTIVDGCGFPSAEVYCYDSCLNSWCRLADMNVARYDFACSEVNGIVYVVGGYGPDRESLSCAEMYDPDTGKWTTIGSLPRPRFGCFACGFEGKLYVMGGRSNFTIGNSRFVDVYDPQTGKWNEMKNGCVMVTTHAVLGKKLFCMEWKNQRKLSVFNSDNNSWDTIAIPLAGSVRAGFQFGILDKKLLLFPLEEESRSCTLVYDPEAPSGSEWRPSELKPSGLCMCSVTIKA